MPPPPIHTSSPPKKSRGCLTAFLYVTGAFVALIVFAGVMGWLANKDRAETSRLEAQARLETEKARVADEQAEAARIAALTPEQRSAEEQAAKDREQKLAADRQEKLARQREKNLAEAKLQEDREKLAQKEAAEAEKKRAADVPGNIKRLAQKELGARYVDSSAKWNDGWIIEIRADGSQRTDHPELLHHEMIQLACRCHPEGMKVANFTVVYTASFTDGLGNDNTGILLQCQMIDSVRSKVNWGNRGSDLYALDFRRLFETELCHPAFRAAWVASIQ